MKPYWWAALLAPLLMACEVWFDLQLPTLMSKIVDVGIAQGDTLFIWQTGLRMLFYALGGIVGGFGCVVFSTIASTNFAADLRRALFHHVQSYTFANMDKFKTGSLITRITNDVLQVQNMVASALRILVRAPLLCIGGMFMAVRLSGELAVVFIISVPILAVGLVVILRRGYPLFRRVQAAMDRVNTIMQENLSGVRVIKAFVRGDFERARFAAGNDSLRDANVRAARNIALFFPLLNLTMNLSVIAVLWLGGGLAQRGGIQVGQLMGFINYMTQILFSLMMSAMVLNNISRAMASSARLNEMLNETPQIVDPAEPADASHLKGRVTFENVSFRYEGAGGAPVLQNVSFDVAPGETLAILGGTGAGKSTLVALIPRLYDPSSGRVLLDGVDVREFRLLDLRSAVSMVLQDSVLFSGTVEDNLRWGAGEAPMDALHEATRSAQAYDFVMAMPEGFSARLGRGGVNLSGGQKQRLSIARSLAKRPRVLILDDSTSAVDMSTEAHIQEALRHQRCTVIVIAQRISSVMDADRILVLEDGAVSAMGTHEELLRQSPLYREICASQLGKEAV